MLLAVVAMGANFWGFPVYVLDEAKNAACAMEMLQRGDWVVPTFNGQLRTDKPPLHYFFMMTSYSVFGVTPFAARFFSVLMGLLTVAAVYFFVKRMEGERVALFSGLVMVSSFFVVGEFHLAVPDPYFICFLTLCWLSFAYGLESNQRRYFYLSYVAMALAFMAKGPVALVLSAAILGSFLFLRKGFSWNTILSVKPILGLLIFLLMASPWWIAIAIQTDGEWVKSFLWGHNLGRYLSPYEDHGNVPGMAVLLFLVALLPLSALLPGGLYHGWKERASRPLALLALLSVVVVLVFFSISQTLLPNYIIPAVPFGAMLIGFQADRWLQQPFISTRRHRVGGILIALVLLVTVPALWLVIQKDRWIGDLPYLSFLFLPCGLGALVAWWYLKKNNLERALISWLAGFWFAGVLLFSVGGPIILARNPVKASLPLVRESGLEVIGYRFFNPAYVFALERPLLTYWTPQDILAYSEGKRVMVLSREDYEAELVGAGFKVVFRQPYLFEGSTALILVNEP